MERSGPGAGGRDGPARFFAACPDPTRDRCLAAREVDGRSLLYFEDVLTMAGARLGEHPPVRLVQLVLLVEPDGRPARMLRLEEGAAGGPRLRRLDRDGGRLDLGPAERSAPEAFLERAARILLGG